MKRLVLVVLGLCLLVSSGFAAETKSAAVKKSPELTLKGDIIDNSCAMANKANLASYVKTHTKECALRPGCVASGYSIFADGRLMTFDKKSNKKI